MILYYDLLKNLKLIEIKVLVGYDFRKGERIKNFTHDNFSQYLEKLEIDHLMFEYIEEKLIKYKLLNNSFNADFKKNLDKITRQMGQIREAIRIISNNKGSNFQQYKGSLHLYQI